MSRISLAAVPTRTHLFDGVETVLQRSNSDHEIVATRIQREHLIIGARTHLLSRNVSVQILNGTGKVGDQYPDLPHRLSRHNATLSSDLKLMFHHSLHEAIVWQKASEKNLSNNRLRQD
jgi:hypothetical protein